MFKEILSRNIKAYVNDMVVNSAKGDTHTDDPREAFECMRKHSVCFDSTKCTFLVK